MRSLPVIIVVLFSFIITSCGTTGVEEPSYKSLVQDNKFEIREYAPRIIAQTTVNGTQKSASNKAFRILADYIFGNNTSQSNIDTTTPATQSKPAENSSEKIAMTAPVTQYKSPESSKTASIDSEWIVQFTIPAEFTIDTLPKPNNPAVEIVQLPPLSYAVLKFSGRVNESLIAQKTTELEAIISERKLQIEGEIVLAQYNPPWILGPFRRNELLMPLAPL